MHGKNLTFFFCVHSHLKIIGTNDTVEISSYDYYYYYFDTFVSMHPSKNNHTVTGTQHTNCVNRQKKERFEHTQAYAQMRISKPSGILTTESKLNLYMCALFSPKRARAHTFTAKHENIDIELWSRVLIEIWMSEWVRKRAFVAYLKAFQV